MTSSSTKLSHWAKLSIFGFTFGGSYFVVEGLLLTASWWLLSLLLTFVLLVAVLALSLANRWQHTLLGILFLLCVLISVFVQQHATMLYVVVCLLAIETLQKRMGIIWVLICVLSVFATELVSDVNMVNLQDALVNSLLTLFLSGFAFLRVEAEKSRAQSRQLLHELEEKNLQLAAFAAEHERQSILQERQHLSRELHDTLGHKLTTSIVQLEAADRFLEKDPARVKSILTTAKNLLKEGLDETRDIVRILDRDETKSQSLFDLITMMVDAFRSATDLTLSLNISCDEAIIPQQHKQHILRIIQEALTNVSRHADATEVQITLTTNNNVELLVKDNGTALNDNPDSSLPTIKSISSRVNELTGNLNFKREDAWTTLFIEIPIKQTGDEYDR